MKRLSESAERVLSRHYFSEAEQLSESIRTFFQRKRRILGLNVAKREEELITGSSEVNTDKVTISNEGLCQ